MKPNRRLLFSLALASVALACSAKRIPGTEIDDTPESRAILELMEKYRVALEARDAETILSLISPTFKEESGTATPEDDLDFKGLQKELADRLSKVDSVKLALTVKKIKMHPDNIASAVYHYNGTFKLPGTSNKPRSESDIKEMWFKRDGGKWKISSGI